MATPLERAKRLAELLRSHGNPADGCVACLEQAIAAAVAEEREACAKIADSEASKERAVAPYDPERRARQAEGIARDIRARGIK